MGVEFNEPSYASPAPAQVPQKRGIRALVVKYGLAKDLAGADRFLLAVAGLALLAAAWFLLPVLGGGDPPIDPDTYVAPE